MTSRRKFLASTAAIAAAAALPRSSVAAPTTISQPTKLNLGLIGVGKRGMVHVREVSPIPNAQIAALCDVDSSFLVDAARMITDAKVFVDFREMLQMPGLDAVLIATPDHSHAAITAAALRAGKHVYCEKPLAHTVHEVRAITKLAEETKLVTQLGIQIHAQDNYRRVVELIQSGAIGPVHEVVVFHNRGHGTPNPAEIPVPPSLNYGLWLGPLSARPFRKDYHPYHWRRWWAFGSAMLGDIGCHFMDVAFWALDLKSPTRISSEGAGLSPDTAPEWIIASYDFPARGSQPPVKLTWYDHPKEPPMRAQWQLNEKYKEGVMFIGESGMLFTNYRERVLLPEEKFKNHKPPAPRIASSPGHQREWVNACLANDPKLASAPFSYGGPLSETALLGTVSFRAQKALDWNALEMKFPNAPDAQRFLEYEYRAGWSL